MARSSAPSPFDIERFCREWSGLGERYGAVLFPRTWSTAREYAAEFGTPLLSATGLGTVRVTFPHDTHVVEMPHVHTGGAARCSCGQWGCRHAAAALRSILDGQYTLDWRSPLVTALRNARRPVETPLQLGLVFSFVLPRPPRPDPAERVRLGTPDEALVSLRPGLLTRKGTWNRNVSWADLRRGYRGRHFDPRQVALLSPLEPGGYAWSDIELDHTDGTVWQIVQQATEAGMVIDSEGPDGERGVVQINPHEGVGLHTRLREDDGLSLIPELGMPWDEVTAVWFFGRPIHSLLAWADGAWRLVPLHADPVAAQLAEMGELRIPAEDADEFARDFLPDLRRHSSLWVSGDDDGEPLCLLARYVSRGVEGATLSWGWRYGDRECPLPLDPADLSRSPAREDALMARLTADQPLLLDWIGEDAQDLDPVQSCQFGLTLLPVLRDHPDIMVEIRGDLPDYQPPEQARIIWDATDTDERDWFDLAVELEVDGVRVSMAALIECLVSGDEYLVLPDGTYIDLFTEEMNALRALLDEAAQLEIDHRPRVSRHRLDLWERLIELGQAREQGRRWRQKVGSLVLPDRRALPPPSALKAVLRDYQVDGFRWLSTHWEAGVGGILADDMGLGKTVQVLAAIAEHRATDAEPVLITAPRSVLGTWQEQAATFVPGLTVSVVGRRLAAGRSPIEGDPDVVITSHQLARLDAERYARVEWSALIIDEAQVVKNPATALHKALRRIPREVTFAVTGTPMENSVRDLWALMELVAPSALPGWKDFNDTFRRPIETDHDEAALAALRRRLAPFLLRRTKEEVAAELPPRLEQVVAIDLGRDHRARYRRQLDHERQLVLGLLDDEENNGVEILASLARLRKLAADPGEIEHPSEKAGYLLEQLVQLREEGHRALVFSQYTSHLRVVAGQLDGIGLRHEYLDGATVHRQRVIDRFRDGDADVFLISLKAGGVGITLTEADYVFLLDPWWNPAVESQAVDRTHRIGQVRPVNVYRLVSRGTIEEKVSSLQEGKRALAGQLLNGSGAPILDPAVLERLLRE